MRRLAAFSLGALLLLAGCGGDGKEPTSEAAETTSTTAAASGSGAGSAPSTPGTTSPASTPTTAADGPATTQTTTGSGGTTPTTRPTPSDFPIKVTFAKACVDPGGQQTIKVDTEADVAIAYVIEFAGGQANQDATYGGLTNRDGHFEHTFTVRADVPRGEARAHVNGQKGDRKSYATHVFTVGC